MTRKSIKTTANSVAKPRKAKGPSKANHDRAQKLDVKAETVTLAGTARDVAVATIENVTADLRDRAAAVKDAAEARVADLRDLAAEAGGRVAGSLRAVADGEAGNGLAARALGQTANGVSDLAQRLEGTTIASVGRDARDFARRHPVASMAVAAVAGIALVRLAKAAPLAEFKDHRA